MIRGPSSTSKLHVVVDGLGNPVRFIVTPGQTSSIGQAEALIKGLPAEHVLANKAYNPNHVRQAIDTAGAKAVIPSSRARAIRVSHDAHFYKERNLVERFFNKAKHVRRIATRYEQTARTYLSIIHLVAAVI